MIQVTTCGFTGTSKGMTVSQKRSVRKLLEHVDVLHHGDCIGADSHCHKIAKEMIISIIIHPPEDNKARAFCKGAHFTYPPKPYLKRNHDIVDNSEFMIATPKEFQEVLRSGTWATIRYALKKNKRVYIVWPDGKVDQI